MNVKGFEGIRIHPGNSAEDTEGCLLVGENKEKGKVLNSRTTFERLMAILLSCEKRKEQMTIKNRVAYEKSFTFVFDCFYNSFNCEL